MRSACAELVRFFDAATLARAELLRSEPREVAEAAAAEALLGTPGPPLILPPAASQGPPADFLLALDNEGCTPLHILCSMIWFPLELLRLLIREAPGAMSIRCGDSMLPLDTLRETAGTLDLDMRLEGVSKETRDHIASAIELLAASGEAVERGDRRALGKLVGLSHRQTLSVATRVAVLGSFRQVQAGTAVLPPGGTCRLGRLDGQLAVANFLGGRGGSDVWSVILSFL